jgi:hypothetical protein
MVFPILIDFPCLLCGEEDEDLEHFLLRRQLLETTRQETIYAIDNEVNTIINRRMHQMSNEENTQISTLFDALDEREIAR